MVILEVQVAGDALGDAEYARLSGIWSTGEEKLGYRGYRWRVCGGAQALGESLQQHKPAVVD